MRASRMGEFLEYAEVFGNYYGTQSRSLERAVREGADLVLDIDVQGARQLKEQIPEAYLSLFLRPSREVLEQRLRARSQDSEDVIERRLRGAAEEIRNYTQYDYVLVNREIERLGRALESIVKADAAGATGWKTEIRPILESFRMSKRVEVLRTHG